MNSESLQILKRPNIPSSRERLKKTGIALDYFKAFEQDSHDFHSHEFVEILFVLNGSFRHITADRTYDEFTGGLTILNYNQYHSLKTPDGPVELMNIYIDPERYPFPDLPETMTHRLQRLIPLHPELGNRMNRIHHLIVPDPGKLSQILKMMFIEQTSYEISSEFALEALFRLFLLEICRAVPVEQEEPSKEKNRRMERVIEYLERSYTQQIRLDELCRICNLNKANLCRRFKEYTGMSTGDYLRQRRLAAALQRLRTTDDKILTVCLESGFPDISRFNRIFKAAFGYTPSEYRKKNSLI